VTLSARLLRLALCAASMLSFACASAPVLKKPSYRLPSAPPPTQVVRPSDSADYDVLVAGMAAEEGNLAEARAAFERAAEKDPDSAYLQRRLGNLAAQMDDLPGALAYAERAAELDPTDIDSRIFLGRLYRIRRDAEGAERALLGEDGEPVSAAASLLLYQVYLEQNRLPEALELVKELLAEDPEDLGAYMAIATVYERMDEADMAELTLREALVHHPGRLVLYSRLARMRRAAEDPEGEAEIWREVLAERPHHYGSLVSLGEALIALNDLDGAIATYAEIADHYPDDHQALRRLASLEFAAGRYQQAADRLEQALERNPERSEFAYSLGQVQRGMSADDLALASFERVPEDSPVYVEARIQIATILEEREDFSGALVEVERIRRMRTNRAFDFHVASLRARAGNFEGGVALLEEMLAADPNDDEVLYQLGVLYGSERRVDEAMRYMRATLEHNPDNAQALNYIGYTLAERGENLDEAEDMIRRALAQRPADGYITDSLGWVFYMRARPLVQAGRVEDANALLEQATEQLTLAAELTGGDPVVYEHLGDVYLLKGDKPRALEFYEQAVDLEYREDEQPNLIEKLERLRTELAGQ
jgi:tetratricopeptide (TPR) repeat protein